MRAATASDTLSTVSGVAPTDVLRGPAQQVCNVARSLVHALGSVLVRVSETGADAVPATRGGTELVRARTALTDALSRAAARGDRYGWPFTIVVVKFDASDRASVQHVVDGMWERLRAGDEMHRYRDDAIALILPAMPNDTVPDMLARITARASALHFGVANSPLEGGDAVTLLSLAEHRVADAAART